MDTFSIVRDAIAKAEADPDKVGLDEFTLEVGHILSAVQVVVDALTPPDGGRYIVGFKDIATAGTFLGDRTITVSSKPLRDPTLTKVEKAVVTVTFTAHEIGHTLITRPRKFPVDLIKDHNGHSGYHSVANIADDIVLEPFMVDRFPILQDAFEFTGAWVLRNGGLVLPVTDTLNAGTTAAQRFNIVLHATRYGDIPEIIWTPGKMTDERDWCRDWAARLLASPVKDHGAFLALCDEVWEHIREVDPEPEPIIDEPEPPVIIEPPEGGDDDEDEDEDEDEPEPEGPVCGPVGPTGEPKDDDDDDEPKGGSKEPEPEDREGADFDEKPEPTDEDGEDGEDGESDEPTDGGDEPTDGEDEDDESEDGESEDGEGGEPEPDERPTGHEEGNAPTPDDAEGGGGNAEHDRDDVHFRDEDDIDLSEVEKTTHDQAEQPSFDADDIEKLVRTYASTTVTTFGRHGTLSTRWD